MPFIKFQKEKIKKGGSSKTIGLNQKGRFVFYKPVIQKYFDDKNFVELYYDPDTKKMGILPLAEPNTDSFKVQGKTTKMIIAKKFLNRFKINLDDRRYEFAVNEEGMLVIQL